MKVNSILALTHMGIAGAAAGAASGASPGTSGAAQYTPTSSIPSTSPSTPSSGTPFGAPNAPQFERTRFSLFGRLRKSTSDQGNQRLTNQPQMMQRTTPSAVPGVHPPSHTGSVTISVSVSTSWLPRLTRHFHSPRAPNA